MRISEKLVGSKHPGTLSYLTTLGRLYITQEKYGEAEPLCLQTLTTCEQVPHPEHLLLADNLNNLATLYEIQGKYSQAGTLFLRALVIREQTLQPEHPDIVDSHSSLAKLYHKQGKDSEAAMILQQMSAIQRKVAGRDASDTVRSLDWQTLFRIQRNEQARESILSHLPTFHSQAGAKGRKSSLVKMRIVASISIDNSGSNISNVTTVTQFIANRVVGAGNPDHIVAIVGWPFSSQVINACDIIAGIHLPMISQTASSVLLSGDNPYFFRVSPPDDQQGKALGNVAVKQLHASIFS